jgi:hypothetical protein
MTICDGSAPIDRWISEDQDLVELIEGTMKLAIIIFSFPRVVMTHLGGPAPSAQTE